MNTFDRNNLILPYLNERWFVIYQYTDSLGRIIQVSGKEGGLTSDVVQDVIYNPFYNNNDKQNFNP